MLSGGMKRKFSFFCPLIHNPKPLILDEPTGVDPTLRAALWEHFRKVDRSGSKIIIATRYMDEATTNPAALNKGRKLATVWWCGHWRNPDFPDSCMCVLCFSLGRHA